MVSSARAGSHPRSHRLRPFAQRVAVVRALLHDHHRLPRGEPDVEREEMRLAGPRGIDVPDQPMWIAQARRPNFLARTIHVDERVVVRYAVAPVLADRARGRVPAQVRNDAQDLPADCVEPLRIEPADVALFARARVAEADIHDAPVRIAAPGAG